MAKMTALEIFNAVLTNIGEATVLSLTSLSGVQIVVRDKITEAIQEICTDENTRWQFLESFGSIPLATGAYRYLISGLAAGADMQREDRDSFIQTDTGTKAVFKTPQEWDKAYPRGILTSMTGYPDAYMRYAGYIVFNRYATAAENAKTIDFRYWKQPSYIDTGAPSGTLDIPEPFDRLVLVALATLKVLTFLGNDEAMVYKMTVYGDGRDVEGNLAKMIRIYGSPGLKTRLSMSSA